jgi:beta-glucosidase
MGEWLGLHAPGNRDLRRALTAGHHLLLSHGMALESLRANAGPAARLGITLNLTATYPASDRSEDEAAARRQDGFINRWFLDPLYRGRYPEDMLAQFEGQMIEPQADDMAIISRPFDFLGVNYYTRWVCKAAQDGMINVDLVAQGGEHSEMGWEVYPEGLYDLLTRVQRDYTPNSLYITENGAAFVDTPDGEGQIRDTRREAYLREHFVQAQRAIAAGAPLHGYFVWSLMDNFEWGYGYGKRFGLVYVDYATQVRTIKQSGRWYGQVTRQNGLACIE